MVKPEYRGARGSNAGDDFHELWTLRQTLKLLEHETNLTAVAVEGLRVEDEGGSPQDSWEGVDCTFYFGGDTVDSAERIVIDQLKYSSAKPEKKWTVARLSYDGNKSVLRRLAKAFSALKEKRSDLVNTGNLIIRLVSNQQIDQEVLAAIAETDKSYKDVREILKKASGLNIANFKEFASVLDFSECGIESRFALEERIIATMSEWTDGDARGLLDDLMRMIRRKMMPEGKGEFITLHSILARLGFSDPLALFPCPAVIKKVEDLIPREASRNVLDQMLEGEQRICLHGDGGCGKTTVLQEIEEYMLAHNSIVVIFDCYGGGRYLDSDACRHRNPDAFLQLSNDLARQLQIPLLLTPSDNHDYPRVFKKWLNRAAEVVSSIANDAVLVVIIDAVDNSVTAGNSQSPKEKSFIHDFMALGDLPRNVRFLVTVRTGRLPSINLPHKFNKVPISGFTRDETGVHVRGKWKEASDNWIDDFHYLSQGNPRVQRYALDYANDKLMQALEYLRPNGKGLEQIFQGQLDYAQNKAGHEYNINAFCAALITLPRPIPIADLSIVMGLSEHDTRDLCADLAPGIRLIDGLIGFADEDFEHFIRSEAKEQVISVQSQIADHFSNRHRLDSYAATHIAEALFLAGRGKEIMELINTDSEPKAIGDPILRRETQLRRLRIAMKVCREAGNTVDSILTLIIGGDALKTGDAIHKIFIENPDLAVNFARDTFGRIVLRNSDEIEKHGHFLFQRMAIDAFDGDKISVREGKRQVNAWLKLRKENLEDQEKEHPGFQSRGWEINDQDVAAGIEAVLRTEGARYAIDSLKRWRPRSFIIGILFILSYKLIASGEAYLIEQLIKDGEVPAPWDLFLHTPLALAGKNVDLSKIRSSLASLLRRGLIQPEKLRNTYGNDNAAVQYLDTILTACEIIITNGGDSEDAISVLKQIADEELRRCDRLFTSQVTLIDFSLRAHAILEQMVNRKMTIETYLINPPEPTEDLESKESDQAKRQANEKKVELKTFIGPLIDMYDIRAQALLGLISPKELETRLHKAIENYHHQDYQLNRQSYASSMRIQFALALTRLIMLSGLDRNVLMGFIDALLGKHSNPFNDKEVRIFTNLAADYSLHQQILEKIVKYSEKIKSTKTSADEKITALLSLSRALLPVSHSDAEALFNEAVNVAGEVNFEAIYEIALLAPLADRAVEGLSCEKRRTIAHDVSVIVGDAAIRLEGNEHFPWEEVALTLSTLDVPFALATVARWEDSSIIGRATYLPFILYKALSRREMTPVQGASLLTLLDEVNADLIDQIVIEELKRNDNHEMTKLANHLAREELLRFSKGGHRKISGKLRSLVTNDSNNYWFTRLVQMENFCEDTRTIQMSSVEEEGTRNYHDVEKGKKPDPLENIDWESYRLVSAEEIASLIVYASEVAREAETFVSESEIFNRMRNAVKISDRVVYLNALSKMDSRLVLGYALAEEIERCINDWYEMPSISRWCRENLIQVIIELLPSFNYLSTYKKHSVQSLLKKTGLVDKQICAKLIEGMERHVETLGFSTLCSIVGLIGRYCEVDDAAKVLTWYTERLVQRIPNSERDKWDVMDIPTETSMGIARLLYSLMGDIDVRIRWRSAHALRCLMRLGDVVILGKIVELYDQMLETSYRNPDAPFYWLAARLWFVISLDRIANEIPSGVELYGFWLLEIARDEAFPHILIRSFAKSAVCKLVEKGKLMLDSTQQDALKQINLSPIPRKKVQQVYYDRHKNSERKGRRFDFDGMDTLPDWYSNAIHTFADVDQKEFLDVAEQWIIDCWGMRDTDGRWGKDSRKNRFSQREWSLMRHGQGTRPTLERLHTYLEWHAMWCGVGELMQTRALAINKDDDYYKFENWIKRESLSVPPMWLYDFLSPKPLENKLWFSPDKKLDLWLEDVDDDEFLDELELGNDDGRIIVASGYNTQSKNFYVETRVCTALVSPKTARALIRALQTTNDSWDYRIPPAGDDHEIDVPPYKLMGWLVDGERNSGIDEKDPLRYGVSGIGCQPSIHTVKSLNLTFINDEQVKWVENECGKTIFIHEAWDDDCNDENEERSYYDETVRSNGWRLRVDKDALQIFLNKTGVDLIVEIEITRRDKGYGYSRYDKEEAKESRFDRVILLRSDGTIEAAERCLGTWTVPSK